MYKTRFDSQRMILNVFFKIIFQNTLMARETPPPFMANAILNFHFCFLNHSLIPSTNDDINAKSECKCNGLELHYKPDEVTFPQSPKRGRRS